MWLNQLVIKRIYNWNGRSSWKVNNCPDSKTEEILVQAIMRRESVSTGTTTYVLDTTRAGKAISANSAAQSLLVELIEYWKRLKIQDLRNWLYGIVYIAKQMILFS